MANRVAPIDWTHRSLPRLVGRECQCLPRQRWNVSSMVQGFKSVNIGSVYVFSKARHERQRRNMCCESMVCRRQKHPCFFIILLTWNTVSPTAKQLNASDQATMSDNGTE